MMRRTTILGIALVAIAANRPAQGVDTTWTFNGDGNWNTAGQLEQRRSASTVAFNATIDDGDTAVTVTLNVNAHDRECSRSAPTIS